MKEEEFKIIQKKLPEAYRLFSILPGDTLPDFDYVPFTILSKNETESDIRLVLQNFLRIWMEQEKVTEEMLCSSFIAYLQLKVLAEAEKETFDKHTLAILSKEYMTQSVKLGNIRELTEKQLESCEAFEKDRLGLTVRKYELLLKAIDRELAALRVRKPDTTGVENKEKNVRTQDPSKKEEKREKRLPTGAAVIKDVFQGITSRKTKKQPHNEIDLKIDTNREENTGQQEAEYVSQTKVMEKTCKEQIIRIKWSSPCHIVPEFIILQDKEHYYFGEAGKLRGKEYKNDNGRLYELVQAGEDFIQFMTQDLLTGEFSLKRFTREEREALGDYYSFMSWIFEVNLGRKLSVKDYLIFQDYYNRLYLAMYEEEQKYLADWYHCLKLADDCLLWLNLYGIETETTVAETAGKIQKGKSESYLKGLKMIRENYGINENFCSKLDELIEEIQKTSVKTNQDEQVNQEEALLMQYSLKDNEALFSEYQELLELTDGKIRFVVTGSDSEGESPEEAVFSESNVLQAVYDFMHSDREKKNIKIRINTFDFLLFTAAGNSIAIQMIEEPDKERFEKYLQMDGSLLNRYANFLAELMNWITEVKTS